MTRRSHRLAFWTLSCLACVALGAMTVHRIAHSGYGATATAAAATTASTAAALETPTQAPPDSGVTMLRRGAELSAIGDCVVCHTAKDHAPFAGGRPLDTPFGTIYSTNITPDRQTGIGAWSLADFTHAMRDGVSRDGHLLYPAFPYPHFTHMTDRDIAAIYTYLMSRNAVQASAPANDLMFPFNFRPLVAGWNLLFLHAGIEPDGGVPASAQTQTQTQTQSSSHDAVLQRGKYLIDGPAHCAACHTPGNFLGAEKRDDAFGGNVIEGWEAPALTVLLQAPRPWTHDQLVAYLRTGFADQHGAAAGPMRPVTQSLANASDADINAMATYLLSLQPPRSLPSAQEGPKDSDAENKSTDSAQVHNGAMLFTASCASCHADHAPMSTFGGRPSLAFSTSVNAHDPRNTLRMILDGIPAQPGTRGPMMPAFGAMLTDSQIADIATFLRARFSRQPAWTLDASNVATLRKEASEP